MATGIKAIKMITCFDWCWRWTITFIEDLPDASKMYDLNAWKSPRALRLYRKLHVYAKPCLSFNCFYGWPSTSFVYWLLSSAKRSKYEFPLTSFCKNVTAIFATVKSLKCIHAAICHNAKIWLSVRDASKHRRAILKTNFRPLTKILFRVKFIKYPGTA